MPDPTPAQAGTGGPLSLTCNNCRQQISGRDEDELVNQVQAHVAEHSRQSGHPHVVTREQILVRLQRRSRPDT